MYNEENIFAKIINGEMPANKVYEDDNILAFHDIAPVAPVHVIVVPKGKYVDYEEFVTNAEAGEVKDFFVKVKEIAESLGVSEEGYRVITNKGEPAGQTVFHFHIHIIGGKKIEGLIG